MRAEYFPRAFEEREILRRTACVADPMSLDEAAMDRDLFGHDFYLFTEIETGHHAMTRRLTDGRYGLRGSPADAVPVGTVVRVVLEGPAESLTPEQAVEHPDTGGDRFAFHIDPTSHHRVTPQ